MDTLPLVTFQVVLTVPQLDTLGDKLVDRLEGIKGEIAGLRTDLTAHGDKITAEIQEAIDRLAQNPTDDDIQAVITSLQSIRGDVQGMTQLVDTIIPDEPTPPPTPTP